MNTQAHNFDDYAKFMREGAYDDEVAVVATVAALERAFPVEVREAA